MIKPKQFFEICKRFNGDWQEINGCIVSSNFQNAKKTVAKLLADGSTVQDVERFCNHDHASMLLQRFDDYDNTDKNRKSMVLFHEAITSYGLSKKFPGVKFIFEIEESEKDFDVTYYHVE